LMRMKLANNGNENLAIVYFSEIMIISSFSVSSSSSMWIMIRNRFSSWAVK
jgi:hypothetical protein